MNRADVIQVLTALPTSTDEVIILGKKTNELSCSVLAGELHKVPVKYKWRPCTCGQGEGGRIRIVVVRGSNDD